MGAGANFAVSRACADEVGGFDTALGAGAPCGGGDDLDYFLRAIKRGWTLSYEPRALVWHHHRADGESLLRQVAAYGSGATAYAFKHAFDPTNYLTLRAQHLRVDAIRRRRDRGRDDLRPVAHPRSDQTADDADGPQAQARLATWRLAWSVSVPEGPCRLSARAETRLMLTLALLPPAAAFLALTAGTSVVRSLAALLAMTFTPGYAVLTFFPRLRMPLRVGVAAAISLAIFAIGSAFMIGISWFEPWALLTIVLVPSCAILAIRVAAAKRRPEREPSDKTPLARRDKIAIGTIVGALLLWAVSMPAIDPDSMRDLGLLTEFPITWYFAIFLTTIGAAVYATRQGTRPSIMFAYIAALIAMLYSTTPLIYDLPHYQWVYKHVGVTLQFMEVGTLIPDTDLYNRWPGLFALGGVYSEFAGYANPLSFVGWAEFYFIALQTSLVAAISYGGAAPRTASPVSPHSCSYW